MGRRDSFSEEESEILGLGDGVGGKMGQSSWMSIHGYLSVTNDFSLHMSCTRPLGEAETTHLTDMSSLGSRFGD